MHHNNAAVLIHGLGAAPWIMRYLAKKLRQHHYTPFLIKYPSLRKTFAENLERIYHQVQHIEADKISIVAHSLGGIMALTMQNQQPDPRIQRMVLLGSPVQGSACARVFAARRYSRWVLGRSVGLWENMPTLQVPTDTTVGMIAGNKAWKVSSGYLTALPSPHDGVVTVAETQLAGLQDHIILPVTHTGMLFSPQVAQAINRFLDNGRF